MPELLRADGIGKRYGGVHALRNASSAPSAGEAHALVGENDAGKSTLAKIVAGSVRPDAGRILIDGKPASIRNPLESQRLMFLLCSVETILPRSRSLDPEEAVGVQSHNGSQECGVLRIDRGDSANGSAGGWLHP